VTDGADGRGTRELGLVLLVYVPALLITIVTYWRLPGGSTYHFDETGPGGAISRTIVELNYPVAIGAIALAWFIATRLAGTLRWVAVGAAVACATVAVPGIVSQADLAARDRNLPAALGALVALGLTATVIAGVPELRWARHRTRGDTIRIVLAIVMLVLAIPWIVALFGFYVSDVPGLGTVFRGAQPTPGQPSLASVHRGLHEGLAGVQLAITALLLSRCLGLLPAGIGRTLYSLYVSLMLTYGVMVALQDGWNEQLIKRGVVSWDVPSVLTPELSVGWAIVIAAAVLIHVVWFGPELVRSSAFGGTTTADRSSLR
jgi:hypothetical protein